MNLFGKDYITPHGRPQELNTETQLRNIRSPIMAEAVENSRVSPFSSLSGPASEPDIRFPFRRRRVLRRVGRAALRFPLKIQRPLRKKNTLLCSFFVLLRGRLFKTDFPRHDRAERAPFLRRADRRVLCRHNATSVLPTLTALRIPRCGTHSAFSGAWGCFSCF